MHPDGVFSELSQMDSRIDKTEETRWGARFFALPHSSGFFDTLNQLRRMLNVEFVVLQR